MQKIHRIVSRFFKQKMPIYLEQFEATNDFSDEADLKVIYIICSTARSGSHFLGHTLKEEDDLGYPLEYFNPENFIAWKKRFNTQCYRDTLVELIKKRTSLSGVFGCKMHFSHMREMANFVLPEQLFNNPRHILIYRDDILRQAISHAIAIQTGQWISRSERKGEPKYDERLILKCLNSIVWENACWRHYFKENKIEPLFVKYEDLLADQTRVLNEVRDYIGVPIKHPKTQKDKIDAGIGKQSGSINDIWLKRFEASYESAILPALKV